MLATHNSATGERPRNLWARLFPMVAKCQDKTIKEQYDAGARLFDIRVRWIGGMLRCCHGLAVYDKTLQEVLNELKMNPTVWVMVTYEGMLSEDGEDAFFNTVLDECEAYGVNCGHVSMKYPEWNIISPSPRQPSCAQNYTKIVGWRMLWPFPRFWNWLRLKSQVRDEERDGMVDFL